MNLKEVSIMLQERYEELNRPSMEKIARNSRFLKQAGMAAATISKPYFNQILSGDEKIANANISFDIFWTLGIKFQCDPVHLFCIHREAKRPTKFDIIRETDRSLGELIRHQRKKLDLSLNQGARLSKQTPFSVSSSTWSWIENDKSDKMRLKGETLFAIAAVLHIDPALLYVMARGLDAEFLEPANRRNLLSSTGKHHPQREKTVKEKGKAVKQKGIGKRTISTGSMEGLQREVATWVSGRDPKIAEKKKLTEDYVCAACGFRLVYNGYPVIHCHHKNPLEEGMRKTVSTDLLCLCPTCHVIAHLGPPHDVYEIREIRRKVELREVK